MVMTISTVLHMPITLFTSIPSMPTVCILPMLNPAISTQPFFLAYTQTRPGHYDLVLPIGDSKVSEENIPCKGYCGQKSDSSKETCTTLHCTCYRRSKGCHSNCKCKGCTNKNGVKTPQQHPRKRKKYDEQQLQPLKGRKTEDFMHTKREVINYGSLTAFEDISIAMHFALHGIPITAAYICIAFQKVYNICQTSEVQFPIFQPTQDNIRRFLKGVLLFTELFKLVI